MLTRDNVLEIIATSRARATHPNFGGMDLHGLDLSEADLRWVDFRKANLNSIKMDRSDLSWAKLHDVNLARASLTNAHLRNADCSDSVLCNADLRGAHLMGANLRNSDLHNANLFDTRLTYADLSGVNGLFVSANLGRHDAIAAGGFICIGCLRYSYGYWQENGHSIGEKNDYSEAEIARYLNWMHSVLPWLSDAEKRLWSSKGNLWSTSYDADGETGLVVDRPGYK